MFIILHAAPVAVPLVRALAAPVLRGARGRRVPALHFDVLGTGVASEPNLCDVDARAATLQGGLALSGLPG